MVTQRNAEVELTYSLNQLVEGGLLPELHQKNAFDDGYIRVEFGPDGLATFRIWVETESHIVTCVNGSVCTK